VSELEDDFVLEIGTALSTNRRWEKHRDPQDASPDDDVWFLPGPDGPVRRAGREKRTSGDAGTASRSDSTRYSSQCEQSRLIVPQAVESEDVVAPKT